MWYSIWPKIKQYWKPIIYITIILMVAIVCFALIRNKEEVKTEPKVITNYVVRYAPVDDFAKSINVSPNTASDIRREIINTERRSPDAQFYVVSPNLEKAAVTTEKAIKNNSGNLPKTALEKISRTTRKRKNTFHLRQVRFFHPEIRKNRWHTGMECIFKWVM